MGDSLRALSFLATRHEELHALFVGGKRPPKVKPADWKAILQLQSLADRQATAVLATAQQTLLELSRQVPGRLVSSTRPSTLQSRWDIWVDVYAPHARSVMGLLGAHVVRGEAAGLYPFFRYTSERRLRGRRLAEALRRAQFAAVRVAEPGEIWVSGTVTWGHLPFHSATTVRACSAFLQEALGKLVERWDAVLAAAE